MVIDSNSSHHHRYKTKRKEYDIDIETSLRDKCSPQVKEQIYADLISFLTPRIFLLSFDDLNSLYDMVSKEIAKRTLEDHLFWNDEYPSSYDDSNKIQVNDENT